MRHLVLAIALLFLNTVHADVNPAAEQLARQFLQEALKLSVQPLNEARVAQQTKLFQDNVELGVEGIGELKFSGSNRWQQASQQSRDNFKRVANFYISQMIIGKFTDKLHFVRMHNPDLAEKLRIEALNGATMKIDAAADKTRGILRVVLFPELIKGPRSSEVTFLFEIDDDKIIDIIFGDIQTAEKSGTVEVTMKKTVMTALVTPNTGQIVTYNADVEREIRVSSEAVDAYSRLFLIKYKGLLQSRHGVKGDIDLNFLIQ